MNLQTFKKGIFHLCVKNNTRIVPVIFVGGSWLMSIGRILPSPGNLFVTVLKPIEYSVFKDMSHDELREYTE